MKLYENKTLDGIHPRILVTEEFVIKNGFSLNHTSEEVADKIKKESAEDFLGFTTETLVRYLSWENAKNFYKEDFVKKVISGEEKYIEPITDVYETVQDFLDYMVFGWMKALDERGISASRTISKISAWLWLLGRGDLSELVSNEDLYNPYGAPALVALCEKIGIEVPKDLMAFSERKI